MEVRNKLATLQALLRERINDHRLAVGVIIVLIIGILLTSVSMWLYVQSGAAGLDLSRPGLSEVRDNIRVQDNEFVFSAEGDLTTELVDQYLDNYRREAKLTEQLGAFDSQPLSDKVLRFNITDASSSN